MVYGYGSPTVEEAYERAHALCRQIRKPPQLFSVLGGLTSVLHMRGKLRQAHALEDHLLRIAQRASNTTFLLWAYLFQGVTAYNRGHLTVARRRVEAALRFYDPRRHTPHASGGREDPGILCLTTLVSALWLLGYPDQALQKLREVQSLVEQFTDPLSRVMVLGQAAVLNQRRREGHAALESADAFLTLAQEQGFSFRVATGMIYRGWALAECGDVNEGITQIRAGLEAIEETGAILARPYYLALLGEAYGKAERIDDALQVLKKALVLAHTNDDRVYEAEVWRLMGVVCKQRVESGNHKAKIAAEAEQHFQQALRVARQQKAKSLELRAAVGLGRAWAARGQRKKAYQLLSQKYRWFTEGFDTADLQEAKVVLAELKE
jgi:tetratricopeptide (TPR) repeat protein